MKNLNEFLLNVNGYKACNDALEWAKDKSWEEIYNTCHRRDWLLWLFKRTNPDNVKELFMAKALCANTVRHLMKDKRSTDAIDATIKFANGEITADELKIFAVAAYAAAYAAVSAAAYAAVNAAADATAYAADAAAYAADAAAYAAAKSKNQLETANICRKVFPIEIWNIK